ncbi:putative NOT transcription complex subunit VIP2 [Primulina tabacum]|uniref:putative NOT transcription complex subunit VIP2 n=1 Tax=Primulina tabacum TaxID=48773 RepID=UPI003F593CAF
MWTPKTSNKSNSNRVDDNGRTYLTPYSTPFVPSSAASASNESGGPPLIPNKPPLVPNKGHEGRIVNSIGGFVGADGSGSSSTGLANVPSSVSGLNLSDIQVMQNIGGLVDYNATQRQKEHLVQPQQYPMGRSPGFMFGAINASHYPLQQGDDSSINGTGFSFPMPGNQDLRFHGSEEYQHFQQPQPRFYNPLRGKEVAQSSRLGPDDYGLLGLLKIIKGANPAKTSLAMGVDPHSLGLDLNSLEPLHQKFASPFSDEPVKEGPKYDIPDCYNSQQPPPLKLSHFKKFHIAMLFYIFYSMPQDETQLFAANELHDRGWYFHRELRMWFMRDSLPAVKNSTYEVGSYICFDPYAWQTIRQENVVLHYETIEQRPVIPP